MKVGKLRVSVLSKSLLGLEGANAFLRARNLVWRRSRVASPAASLVEFAGRVCYMSFGRRQSPKSNAEYIAHLISSGHESVLEHVTWTFVVEGVSRAFTHQLVRHRIGFSYSQLSQQYHDESDAAFVMPVDIARDPALRALWSETVGSALDAYRGILSKLERPCGHKGTVEHREAVRRIRTSARSLLPAATETTIVVTANARALRHFFKLRGGLIGDEEMRRASAAIFRAVSKDAPELFQDFSLTKHTDGLPLLVHRDLRSAKSEKASRRVSRSLG